MRELTLAAALVWVGVIAGAVTIAGVVLDRVAGGRTAAALTAISANQVTLGQILERMDQRADERHP